LRELQRNKDVGQNELCDVCSCLVPEFDTNESYNYSVRAVSALSSINLFLASSQKYSKV